MASALPLPHKASPLTNTIGLSKHFLQPDSRGPAMNGEALRGFTLSTAPRKRVTVPSPFTGSWRCLAP